MSSDVDGFGGKEMKQKYQLELEKSDSMNAVVMASSYLFVSIKLRLSIRPSTLAGIPSGHIMTIISLFGPLLSANTIEMTLADQKLRLFLTATVFHLSIL